MKNGRKNSTRIGSFMQHKDGTMHGHIFGLGLGITPVLLDPQISKDGNPYFRIVADPVHEGYDIGIAFPHLKDGQSFYSISIDSPILPAPIKAALFPTREKYFYNLVWSRQDDVKEPQANIETGGTANSGLQSRARRPEQTQLIL